jgi:proline dehydrogenase
MTILDAPMKKFFLFISRNNSLNTMAKRWGLSLGAKKFVAGETIIEAVNKVKSLNEKGLVCTLDHLGEFVSNEQEAIEATEYCINTLEAINVMKVDSNLSLKLTQIGLNMDLDLCESNMIRILEVAKKYNIFVRIDMEDYKNCEKTINLLGKLRTKYDNIGTVIQAYLYRSTNDIKKLKGVSLRLVKGAYKESANVAFPNKEDVDKNYKRIIKMHLLNGSYTAIASHDERIIDYTKYLVKKHGIPIDQFEFQMLYGMRKEYQVKLVKEGYKVRVYVPYGDDWYGYFMRRLAERPANVAFVLKGMLFK